MTSAIGRAAGLLTFVEGVWSAYFVSVLLSTPIVCPAGGCAGPHLIGLYWEVVIGLAALLVIDGALGFWGLAAAYRAGAALSAGMFLLMAYAVWASYGYPYLAGTSYGAGAGALLGGLGLAANVLGTRARSGLSEQANPMNLPVFG